MNTFDQPSKSMRRCLFNGETCMTLASPCNGLGGRCAERRLLPRSRRVSGPSVPVRAPDPGRDGDGSLPREAHVHQPLLGAPTGGPLHHRPTVVCVCVCVFFIGHITRYEKWQYLQRLCNIKKIRYIKTSRITKKLKSAKKTYRGILHTILDRDD